MQILDSKFENMEIHGKSLINAGVLKHSDIDAGIKGNNVEGQITPVELAAYVLVIELIRSAKSNSTGILLCKFIIANHSLFSGRSPCL